MDEESEVTVDKQYTHENSKVGGCMQDCGVSESSKVSEKHGVSVPKSCASVPGQTPCGFVTAEFGSTQPMLDPSQHKPSKLFPLFTSQHIGTVYCIAASLQK